MFQQLITNIVSERCVYRFNELLEICITQQMLLLLFFLM